MVEYLAYQTQNGLAPEEGPKGMPISIALGASSVPSILKLTQEMLAQRISLIQAMWIDNSLNPELLLIQIPILGQTIRFPRFSQGVVPVFSILPFEAVFTSIQADITLPIILLNMPQPYAVWPAV